MAVTIDATSGGASSNSYVTLVEAQAYMDTRLNGSAWDSASTDSQNRALVEATRELTVMRFIGLKATNTQALQWPRSFAENPDAPWPGLQWFGTTEIPQRVKDAACEIAFQFLNLGTTDLAALDPTLNTQTKKVDVLETTYFAPGQRAQGINRFPRAVKLIRPLLAWSGGDVPLYRG